MNGNNKIVDLIRDTIYEIDDYIKKNKQKDKIIQKNLSDLEKEKTKLADNIKRLDSDSNSNSNSNSNSKLSDDDILLSLVYFYVAKFIIARKDDTPQSSSFLQGFLDCLKKNHQNYGLYIHIQETLKIFGEMEVPTGTLSSSSFTENLKRWSKQAAGKEGLKWVIDDLFTRVRYQDKPMKTRTLLLYGEAKDTVYNWIKNYCK